MGQAGCCSAVEYTADQHSSTRGFRKDLKAPSEAPANATESFKLPVAAAAVKARRSVNPPPEQQPSATVQRLKKELEDKESALLESQKRAAGHVALIEVLERETFQQDEAIRQMHVTAALHGQMANLATDLADKREVVLKLERQTSSVESRREAVEYLSLLLTNLHVRGAACGTTLRVRMLAVHGLHTDKFLSAESSEPSHYVRAHVGSCSRRIPCTSSEGGPVWDEGSAAEFGIPKAAGPLRLELMAANSSLEDACLGTSEEDFWSVTPGDWQRLRLPLLGGSCDAVLEFELCLQPIFLGDGAGTVSLTKVKVVEDVADSLFPMEELGKTF